MQPRPAAIEPDGLFDGLRWSAIVRGAVLDNVLTLIAVGALFFSVAGSDALSEDQETSRRAFEAAQAAPVLLLGSIALGLSITVFTSWWAARRAGALHVRHGGWTAVASAALGALSVLVPGANEGPAPPLWFEALGMGLMLPAGVLGGWIASRRRPAQPA